MNPKVIKIIQIVLAVVAMLYLVMPDLVIGPFDDAAAIGLIGAAELVLGIIQARSRASASRPDSDYGNYQYKEKYTYSNNTDHHYDHKENAPGQDHDKNDSEFQFFAGCDDWEKVKTRYRELMKIYHPDAGGNEEASKKINAEYNILKERLGRK